MGYACSLDPKPEEGPWGGLPHPSIVIGAETCSSGIKIEELMGEAFNAETFQIQHYHQDVIHDNWWELSCDDWETLIGKNRIDFYEKELRLLIEFLEQKTGRSLDMNQLIETLNNVNEQEGWYRKTRDLIAKTVPAPVTVTDTINAVMQAQWHRGSKWAAAESAKSLYEEVKALADNGVAAVKNENVRLCGSVEVCGSTWPFTSILKRSTEQPLSGQCILLWPLTGISGIMLKKTR